MGEIDNLFYEAKDLLKEMIRIPSYSREEKEVADYLEVSFRSWGLPVTIHRSGNNIWLIPDCFDRGKPTLLLNSHIDTVRPVAGWMNDPFGAEEDETGKMTGLGSNDAGASVVSLLMAFRWLIRKPQSYNLIFLASCEEEISGKAGIEMALRELPPIDFAVVGEPTGMHPAVAEKGLMVLNCVVKGKSGHAARNEGKNAILKAIPVIEWFHSQPFPEESNFLGPVKMSVTMIEAGTQHNVVPDECRFTVDVRTNECYSNEQLYKLIVKEAGCEVEARSFRLNSSHTPLEHPFVLRAKMLDREPFGSPTLSDQALMHFPSVKMGPGDSARSHTANEFIYQQEIREAIDIYIRLLDGLQI
ncbi:MAG: M20 family metallo-hydrolase [Tannerellaceae bacterium]|nr:M20 family metallo-hydrolase [Tannerellaceae bacterium]